MTSAGWLICTARGSVMPSMSAKTQRQAIGKWERAFGVSWGKRTRGRRIGWRCVKVRECEANTKGREPRAE
jgi:hypothetical protein